MRASDSAFSPRWPTSSVLKRCAVGLSFLISGCGLEPQQEQASDVVTNFCELDTDCGEGVSCVDNRCEAKKDGRLTRLLFEVTPPASIPELSGARFLVPQQLPAAGTRFEDGWRLNVGRIASIKGLIKADTTGAEECSNPPGSGTELGRVAADGSIPARVVFTPTEQVLGISNSGHSVTAGELSSEVTTAVSNKNLFELTIAPGHYDIYVQPKLVEGPCLAPKLFRNVAIEAGLVDLSLALPKPEVLELTVVWPGEGTLDGWTLDMIDSVSGRVVSNRTELSQPTSVDGRLEYHASLFHLPADEQATTDIELVRLSPPQGVVAPSILIARTAIELFEQGQGVIDQFEQLPNVVTVQGQVVEYGENTPVPDTLLTLLPMQQTLLSGSVTWFSTTVTTDAAGVFEAELVPGTYRVLASPNLDSGLAQTRASLEVSESPSHQAGSVVELRPASAIIGSVVLPDGQPAYGADVSVAASPPSVMVSAFSSALGELSPVPRATRVNEFLPDGRFELKVDPGVFDLTARMPEAAGFAWFVKPALEVLGEQGAGLSELVVPWPVVHRGVLESADTGAIAGGLIRAYVYLDSEGEYTEDPELAASVVQVAESRSDVDGRFELLLPPRLD